LGFFNMDFRNLQNDKKIGRMTRTTGKNKENNGKM